MNQGQEKVFRTEVKELKQGIEDASKKVTRKSLFSGPLSELTREIALATAEDAADRVNIFEHFTDTNKKPTRGEIAVAVVKAVADISNKCGHPLKYCDTGTVYYNGRCWENVKARNFGYFLTVAAGLLGVDFYEAKQAKFVIEAAQDFQTYDYFVSPDRQPGTMLLNCQNGTVEITTAGATLREHRPEDGFFYCLPYNYDPNAVCPMFDNFLNRVCPREEDRMNIQEFVGYVLAPYLHLEKVLYLYGATGANGKTTFKDIIINTIGENSVTNNSFETLTGEGSSAEVARAALNGKILNACGETGRKIRGGDTWFKKLASHETFEARPPFAKENITVRDYASLMFCANNLPNFEYSAGDAEKRRFLFINFDVQIPLAERDGKLTQKISENELPGVLNWAIEGLKRLSKQGMFTDNEESEKITEMFLVGNNSVAAYLHAYNAVPDTDENKKRPGELFRIPLNVLYRGTIDPMLNISEENITGNKMFVLPCYDSFCKDERRTPMGKTRFKQELDNNGFRHVAYHGDKNTYLVYIVDAAKEQADIEKRNMEGRSLFANENE